MEISSFFSYCHKLVDVLRVQRRHVCAKKRQLRVRTVPDRVRVSTWIADSHLAAERHRTRQYASIFIQPIHR